MVSLRHEQQEPGIFPERDRVKRCSQCKEVKPLSAFRLRKSNGTCPPRPHSWCMGCTRLYHDRPEARVKRKARDKKNAEHLREYARRKRAEKPDQFRNYQLRANFGISLDDYQAMELAQSGGCAICGKPCQSGRKLAVDHDHACCAGNTSCGKCVRGLLCMSCNNGLGRFKDDPELLVQATEYIQQHRRP